MNGTKGLFILVFLLALLAFTAEPQKDFTMETPEQRAKRMEWCNEDHREPWRATDPRSIF